MLDDPLEVAAWMKFIIELGIKILDPDVFKVHHKPGKEDFLIYDVNELTEMYKSEHQIAPGIPYLQVANLLGKSFSSVQVNIIRGDFKLVSGDLVWESISKAGFEALKKSGKVGANEPMIHLHSINREKNKLVLKIQRATYLDQAKSNLILDWPVQAKSHTIDLRYLLKKKYGTSLPKLEDKHLANTVGVACLLFYWENNRLIPYLIKRVEKVGVYPGGIHCTASGAANWPNDSEKSFENYFLRAIYQELDEEVGLKPEDITDLKAISLCREFLRGGKPQIFFAGFTSLSRSQLREKRIKAADTLKTINGWPEIDRDTWLQSSDVIISTDKLHDNITKYGITLEGKASYFYGQKYIKKYGGNFIN